jgi:hypothetical protein
MDQPNLNDTTSSYTSGIASSPSTDSQDGQDDEQREFLRDFETQMTELIRGFRRQFPYRQTIHWSVEYGEGRRHQFHVIVKPRSQ